MKHSPQNELIELNALMAKFSVHIDRKLVKTFSAEYRKLLMEVHFKLPHNSLLQQKVRGLETMETELEAGNPVL